MRCRNCGHPISEIEDGVWGHDDQGPLTWLRYYSRKCKCGCMRPNPKEARSNDE